MLKAAFILIAMLYISVSLSSLADTTFSTVELWGQPENNSYQITQPITSYCSPPNQYYQNPYYPHSYLNPIHPQYQNIYPYGYTNYGYNRPVILGTPYSAESSNISTVGSGSKNQIIKNIGQNIMYSLLRGY